MRKQNPQVVIVIERKGPGCFVTLVYFIFVGSWLSLLWSGVAWLFVLPIVTMPVTFKMINMLPKVATLREPTNEFQATIEGNITRITAREQQQRPFWMRTLYFLLIGFWLSGVWMALAWLFSLTLVGIPAAIWMYNRVPAITTLRRY